MNLSTPDVIKGNNDLDAQADHQVHQGTRKDNTTGRY